MRIINILMVAVAILFGCEKKIEIGRTSDGTLKYKAELRNGIRHGTLTEYYPNGSIESVASWKNGEINGEVKHFYEDGSLQADAIWNNGHRVGLYEYYYPNGEILERRLYNSDGQVIYLKKINKLGEVELETVPPIITADSDTLELGDVLEVEIKFGIPLNGDFKVEVGESEYLDSINFNFTPEIELPNEGTNIFRYSKKANKSGKNKVTISIDYKASPRDTIGFEGLIRDYWFYVVQPS